MTPTDKRDLVCQRALEAGFERAGVAVAGPLPSRNYVARWLELGWHGEMDYLAATHEERGDPRTLLNGARSVIVVAQQYKPRPEDEDRHASGNVQSGRGERYGRVARYAWGRDYHRVMRRKLAALVRKLREEVGEPFEARVCVDAAPVAERELAAAAGIGWIGKNTMLLNRELGSYFFLGEIVTTLEMAVSEPMTDHCGRCTRCLDACPTDALFGPYKLMATRCISYLTIEHRSEIPEQLQPMMGDWIFGCDICQEVCPFNAKAPATREARYGLDGKNPLPPTAGLEPLLTYTEEDRQRDLAGSAMKRANADMIRRNAAIAMKNVQAKRG